LRVVFRAATPIAVLALLLAAPAAVASQQDIAATHAYVNANFALSRVGVARIGTAQSRIEALNHKLGGECPLVGKGTPETEASQPMSYEVAAALWSVAYGTNAAPIRAFADKVKPLRWSNRRITRLAESYATSLLSMAALPLPDLCADVRAWTASGFRTIPANVAQLDRHAEAIELNPVPSTQLAPYERGADASVVANTRRLEVELAENEFVLGQDDWIKVLSTLGLPQ
jgi:hypothetical protein